MAELYLPMTYQQVIDYMYARLPMFSRTGSQAIKTGFTNILALCELLGNPQKKGKFTHVAGTNGKGSVSHMLASILQSAGYVTGLYTSPHLKDFRERIKINGKMISESDVMDFIEKLQPEIEKIQPSFFEITVAMAFDFFANNNTDISIIETGLGGRLDSTNIITPILSVITNIGYDHMQVLGDTLEKIAAEKAGIIKPNVPVVIGEKQDATAKVFIDKATELNASLSFAQDYLQVANWQHDDNYLVVDVAQKNKTDHQQYRLDLTAQYQIKNLLSVLQSCSTLKTMGLDITDEAIHTGLSNTKKQTGLHGRWETIHQHPHIVLDVAHNESGMIELLNQLETTSYHKLHIVLGMVKDKDIDHVLPLFPKTATYYFTNADMPRAIQAEELRTKASLYDLNGYSYINVNVAIKVAIAHAHNADLILVCGSVFLVGEVEKI